MEFPQTEYANYLFRKALVINILIFLLVVLKVYAESYAIIGGIIIVGYIFLKGLSNPWEALFLFLGIKFTFDGLWDVKKFELVGNMSIGLLELMILPVLIWSLFGTKLKSSIPKWPIGLLIVYLVWIFFAMAINDESALDFNLFIRQSCLLLGLILGLKYIETIEALQTVFYLVFISTIIPVLVAFLQIILGPSIDLPFTHVTLDPTRGERIAGIYYDAATMGMVVIISLITNMYMLHSNVAKRKLLVLHYMFIPVSLYVAIAGGTRSIIVISLAATVVFIITNIKKSLFLLPFLLVAIFFSQPYIHQVITKSTKEGVTNVRTINIIDETENKYMFSGRVGVWQEVWYRYKSATPMQQIFGTGLSSNAHSSYFFLLLQIGALGLLLYLFYHFLIIKYLLKMNRSTGALFSNLLMGISASTVNYTSFQIATSFIIGSVLALSFVSNSEDEYSE